MGSGMESGLSLTGGSAVRQFKAPPLFGSQAAVQMKKAPSAAPIQMQTERKKGDGVNNHLSISDQGLQFIIKNEGMVKNKSGDKHVLYDDSEDYATIGYGHLVAKKKVADLSETEKARWKNGLTETEALALLKTDCKKFEKALRKHVKIELQQHEFDALISWSFNVGEAWFDPSYEKGQATAIKRLNAGDLDGVGNALGMFQRADGKFNQGVLNRRNREINVFNYGYGDKDDPFRDKGDMAAPQGADQWKKGYWDKHLETHKDESKLDDFGTASTSGKTAKEIYEEHDKSVSKVAEALRPNLGKNDDVIEKMLDYFSFNDAPFAYYLIAPTSAGDLKKVSTDTLKTLRTALLSNYFLSGPIIDKEVGKVDYVLEDVQEEKDEADKEAKQTEKDKKALEAAKKKKNEKTILTGSVGKEGCDNNTADVNVVLWVMYTLNVITEKEKNEATKDTAKLEALVRRYQRRVFNGYHDGEISAHGTTANRLKQGVRGVAHTSADKIENIRKKERRATQDANTSKGCNDEEVQKFYDSVDGDSEKLGSKLADYVRTNPDFVKKVMQYEWGIYRDNIALAIVENIDDYSLEKANKTILQYLYDSMNGGNMSSEEYKAMAELKFYIDLPEYVGPDFSEVELDVKDYWKSQGNTGDCNRFTEMVIDGHMEDNPELYKDFGDIGDGLTYRKNSFHTVWEEDWEKGTGRTQGKKGANDTGTLVRDDAEWEMAIRYITACLNSGVPAMVGVNHTFAYGRASANPDQSTDHWLTIIGKGEDERGKYFSYTDPGTSYKSTGTNTELNRLYQTDDPHIWRDESKYANSDGDAGAGSYTLVAVTLYDNHRNKEEFTVGSETFKRKL